MNAKTLQLQQLNVLMSQFTALRSGFPLPKGWIRSIRNALGMSMVQLGKKLSISKQGILDIEKRELEGAITIRSLREIASALDMEFVYGFVPKDGSIELLIDRKAHELAKQIVMRTATSMQLEDQGISNDRIQKAIEERAAAIKMEIPKMLWN